MQKRHHLIVPARAGGKLERDNGAILCGETSHPYLHLIESKDYRIFYYITSEMIDMNIRGYLDKKNIKNIHILLKEFEHKYQFDKSKKGKLLIKEEYKKRIDV